MDNEQKLRDYLRRAGADLQRTRQRLREVEAAAHEPIAIVGMACRYPGGIRGPEDLWAMVDAGEHGITGFPGDRGWSPELIAQAEIRAGGFLEGAADFDADFFGISPREALAMDPQQRLLLEVSWEAFERAGIDPASVRGSATGVFMGAMAQDYRVGPGDRIDGFGLTGTMNSVLSGRLAYTFGVVGPAVTVDTACSSSLVAMHLAAQSLRAGDSALALAGGVTVMSSPATFIEMGRQGGLSSDGFCRSFDDAADGTGWAEGVGVLVLERLSDAQRLGHRVHAVIRGSAVNQDGASNGLTAPNGPSQQRVIRQALRNAGLTADQVDVVEAHGTGTTLGDPVEAQALLATYGQGRSRPLALGSIKSNIGHSQAAAGIAGVIKMIMAMRHDRLPRTLHLDNPSSHVDWTAGSIRLLTEATEWPRGSEPRRAGVSSFGMSGTNAHTIIEEPDLVTPGERPPASGLLAVPVSGRTVESLHAEAASLATVPGGIDLAFSAATTRAALERRAVVVAEDPEQARTALLALAGGQTPPGTVTGTSRGRRKIAVLFTGQGAQRLGMGRELYERFPVFARVLDEVLAEFPADVRAVMWGSSPDELARTEWAQPALFAVEVALHRLAESWGLRPDLLIGHSIGEIAAAHVAGVFDLAAACRMVAARGTLMQALPAGGAMAAVEADEEQVRRDLPAGVSIAAVNGPRAVVVSGDTGAVEQVAARLAAEGCRVKRLNVSHAFHSHHMDPMLDAFRALVRELAPQPPLIPLVSGVTGEPLTAEQATSADYWAEQIRAAVRFGDGLAWARDHDISVFLELGPDAVLTALATAVLPAGDEDGAALPALRAGHDEVRTLTLALAGLHVRGVPVRWDGWFDGTGARRIDLPTHVFQSRRYWPGGDYGQVADVRAAGLGAAGHPLLAAAVALADSEGALLTGRLSLRTHPWLAHHGVGGSTLLPGTAFLELAIRAGDEVGCDRVEELTLAAPLALPADGGVQMQIWVGRPDTGGRAVKIFSRPESADEPWTLHATGLLTTAPAVSPDGSAEDAGAAWPPPGAEPVDLDGLADRLAAAGFDYGPSFRGLTTAWRLGADIHAEVTLPDEVDAESFGAEAFGVHPALFDAVLHAIALTGAGDGTGGVLPFLWEGVTLYASGATALRARISPAGPDAVSILLTDPAGGVIAAVESLTLRSAPHDRTDTVVRDALLRLDWIPLPRAATGDPGAVLSPITIVGPDPFAVAATLGIPGSRPHHDDSGEQDAPDAPAGPGPAAGTSGPAVAEAEAGRSGGTGPGADQPGAGPAGGVTLVSVRGPDGTDPAAGAHQLAADALQRLQLWGAEERAPGARLVFVSQGATTGDDPAAAAVWGLVRSAQTENPGQLVLVDLPVGETVDPATLRMALASGEPQIAISGGVACAPRLARGDTAESRPGTWNPDGTVLVTGGTGHLGLLLARHLVTAYGSRHVILMSRGGRLARPGDLDGIDAEVTVVAGDAADPADLRRVLDAIPTERPLTAVVQVTGVLADGVIETLTRERLDIALRAKADAAWNLHRATEDRDLDAFVLYSSAAGVLGSAGQGAYAAGNAFLDALAAHRHARGLPALSLAWGPWTADGGMTATVAARTGFPPITADQGMALLDAALSGGPVAVPVRLDLAALRTVAETTGQAPPMLRGLVRTRARRRTATGVDQAAGLQARLLALDPQGQQDLILSLVRGQVAAVLGHADAGTVDPGRAFQDLGFDSLSAVELRNRLSTATGLRLRATLTFDYPNAAALTGHLLGELRGVADPVAVPAAPAGGTDDPIVIVSMACRYPGGVSSPEDLWRLVTDGTDAISGFPADRGWALDALYHPDPDNPGTSYTRSGGFVHDAGEFDPEFFGMSPREALATDAQQRLLLETSWEAVERIGIDPVTLRGSRTGVYVGVMYNDYSLVLGSSGEGFQGSGTSPSVVSGRVSYTLGLEGPAVTVDTACSSSLVAVHLAANALRNGECDLALAGGVTVLATPSVFVEFSRQRGMAPDGRCKAYSDAADGVGWAEGAGLVALERRSDALRNGHEILAVLRGSAVNQDGASNGLTAPNGPSQERVIRQALAAAGLTTADVDVVEGHGTGTTLGDPIEAQALLATYGRDRDPDRPLLLGSIKSNIGHTQAAAGVAGLMKMVLGMRHGVLPRTLHAGEPSSHVDWESGAVTIASEQVPWPETGRPRRAGVSSFGISGTNVHTIVEAAPPVAVPQPAPARDGDVTAWVLSGRTRPALRAQAARLRSHWDAHPDLAPADMAWALATTRTRFPHRAAVVAGDPDGLRLALAALADGESGPGVVEAPAVSGRTALLFTGQGSQWAGMGLDLAARFEIFAEALDTTLAGLGLDRDVLTDPDRLDRTRWTQPALFAVEVALFTLLQRLGVRADLVAGHSIGEITAAHVAGVLSLADACALVTARAELMGELPAGGAMVAVEAAEAEVATLLTDGVAIAAVNGPTAVVIAGVEDETLAVAARLAAEGRRTKRLRVSHAFHSPLMDPMLDAFRQVAEGLTYHPARVPVVTGSGGDVSTAEYWVRHVRDTVRFADAITALDAAGTRVFAEIGPDAVLTELAQHSAAGTGRIFVAAQRRNRDEASTLLTAVARLHVHGAAVDWPAFFGSGSWTDLPTYPFQHERFWPSAAPKPAVPAAGAGDDDFWAAVEGEDLDTLGTALAVESGALAQVLPAMLRWRRERQDRAAVDHWRHRITWRPLSTAPDTPSGTWLAVVGPGTDHDDILAALPTDVRRLDVGDDDRGTLTARLREIGTVDGVVSLLALTEPGGAEPADVPAGLLRTATLLQSLDDAGLNTRLWCVTRGAVSTGRTDPVRRPGQAAVWGLGRVAALEHPGRWGGLVDLPERLDERTAAAFVSALAGRDGEDQVAVRSTAVYGRRLVTAPATDPNRRWEPRGTVLVTGGTGALGGHVARRLAAAGAEHLLLVSRSGPDAPGADRLSADLTALGAEVTITAADVADRDTVRDLLASIPAERPLTGVVHAAGTLDDGVIGRLTPDRFATVHRSKVAGAVHLDELTRDRDLAAFVLFSSASSAVGNPGQGNYAAANAVLDALAEDRAAHGLPATSIAWGAWGGDGMADGDRATEASRRVGVGAMDPGLACEALLQLAAEPAPTAVVADVAPARFVRGFGGGRPSPLMRELTGDTPAGAATPEPLPDLRERLLTEPAGRRLPIVVDLVRQLTADVLGYSGLDQVGPDRPFRDLGVDSLGAVELRNRLQAMTGLVLAATLVFDYPTPAGLAGHILGELLPDGADDEAAVRAALATVSLAQLRELGLLQPLLRVAGVAGLEGPASDDDENGVGFIDDMDVDDLVEAALNGRSEHA